jgi:nickel/cobalt exporter
MGLEDLLNQTGASPVFLAAAALALGALHGLEPGHSKTMMAAFIVAVRGTPWQAVLLGLSAALSHTLIVWVLALLGFALGGTAGANLEGSLVIVSGAVVLAFGLWTALRAWRDRQQPRGAVGHPHHHAHCQGQGHGHHHGHHHGHGHGHGHDHDHDHGHGRDHDHAHHHHDRYDSNGEDAHERAHAAHLRAAFPDGRADWRRVVLFGLSGGLVPCSAAVAVLLVCLHQETVLAGVGLVGAFTLGLAAMLVVAGLLAAMGLAVAHRHRFARGALLRHAPLASGVILTVIGLGMVDSGLLRLGM